MARLSSLTHAVGVARLRSFPIGVDLKKQILLNTGVTGITVETSTIKQYTIKLGIGNRGFFTPYVVTSS